MSAYYIQIGNDQLFHFFILQCLQRGDEGIEPLELGNWYENACNFSPFEPEQIEW